MTIENWLMIAVIISTLSAPTLANFIQSRANSHPKTTPEANQPKNLTQRIGGWLIRLFQSLWWTVGWPLALIAFNIYLLLGELRSITPMTRKDVLLISESVAAILFLLLNVAVSLMQQSISTQGESIRKQIVTISTINQMIKTLGETVDLKIKILTLPKPSQADPDKPPPGILHKMLNAINKVFNKSN